MNLLEELKNVIKGEVLGDEETVKKYSRDASIFEVRPKVVVFPRDVEDLKNLVKFVNDNKEKYPELSLTGRSGGTDMTGGPLTESIVVEFDKYFNNIGDVMETETDQATDISGHATVQPGVYYRDFEKETLKKNLIFPSYPASKSICAIGGIVSNNSGGEKTLRYGKTNSYVRRLKVILSDGNEYEFQKIDKAELEKKRAQGDFEGVIYRKLYEILEDNYDIIKQAKPHVSKNSAGYALWNIWDRNYFDLTQLFVGSQGTLGLLTEAEIALVKKKKYSRLVVVFLKDLERLARLNDVVASANPESLEAFDDNTLKLAIRFLPDMAKKLGGKGFLSLAFSFMGEAFMALKIGGLPKFVVLVELTGNDESEIGERAKKLSEKLATLGYLNKAMKSAEEGEKN